MSIRPDRQAYKPITVMIRLDTETEARSFERLLHFMVSKLQGSCKGMFDSRYPVMFDRLQSDTIAELDYDGRS